jgi:signal transduction histidine kinase
MDGHRTIAPMSKPITEPSRPENPPSGSPAETPTINPITLAFDGEYEDQYLEATADRRLALHRLSLGVAVFAYGLFAILDWVMAPDSLHAFWFIRFAVVCPLALAVLALSFWPAARPHVHWWVAAATTLAGFGISVMIAISEPPDQFVVLRRSEPGDHLLVCLHGLRLPVALIVVAATIAGYEVAAVVAGLGFTTWVSNNFFLLCTACFGVVAGYQIERSSRRDFVLARLLETERDRVRAANQDLESKVRERTAELEATHQQQIALEERLRRTERLEALGQLAGGIAHDFNNLLAAVSGAAEVHAGQCASFAGRDSAERRTIEGAVARGQDLTRRLLAAGRRQIVNARPVEVDAFIEEEAAVIARVLPEIIDLRVSANSGSWISGDPVQLGQVLLNLCINSRDAMPDGGSLTIASRRVASAEQVEIQVRDAGVGMTQEVAGRVFEPFFTTKELGRGTGLGLASVHGTVSQHGGSISLDTAPGQGTTFTILLPAVPAPAVQIRKDASQTPVGGSEHILLVEDEAPVREMAHQMLEHLGYAVVDAPSAADALNWLADPTHRVDVILSDLMMPGMSGNDLLTRVRAENPSMPFVLATGFSREMAKQGAGATDVPIVTKPYRLADLDRAIRRALRAGA